MIKYILCLCLYYQAIGVNNDIIDLPPDFTKTPSYGTYEKNQPLHDILAHCPNKTELNQFRDNLCTWGHESSHQINAFNSIYNKNQAIYVLGGKHVVIIDPGLPFDRIREIVPKNHRIYETYFINQPEQNRKYRIQAKLDGYISTMYLFDEQSAYINGSVIRQVYKLDSEESEIEHAYIMTLYCGYVIYFLETKGIEYDPNILRLYKHQFNRLKSISSDEKHLRTLREDKIGKFLEKIIDLSPKKGV